MTPSKVDRGSSQRQRSLGRGLSVVNPRGKGAAKATARTAPKARRAPRLSPHPSNVRANRGTTRAGSDAAAGRGGRSLSPRGRGGNVRGSSASRGRDSRSRSSLSLGLFVGGSSWGLGLGYSNNSYYSHGSHVGFGFGAGPWYGHSHLHHNYYSPFWNNFHYGHRYRSSLWRYYLPYSTTAWSIYSRPSYSRGFYGGFYRRARYSFGYSHYHPYSSYTPYPFYRRVFYEPYYVSSYATSYPVYRTYNYTRVNYVSDYSEACDPYVEPDDVIDVAYVDFDDGGPATYAVDSVSSYNPTPLEFRAPFVADFPAGLEYEEYLASGEDSLYNADYLNAAEAFRLAMLLRPSEDYPYFQLASALFGAGEYVLGGRALEQGFRKNSAWFYRRFSLADGFRSRDEFGSRLQDLEGHLVQEQGDQSTRLLLAYVYYFSDNLFGARGVLRGLEEERYLTRFLTPMSREAERRLLRKNP